MDDVPYTHKSKCILKDQTLNELKIEREDELGNMKEVVDSIQAKKDNALFIHSSTFFLRKVPLLRFKRQHTKLEAYWHTHVFTY